MKGRTFITIGLLFFICLLSCTSLYKVEIKNDNSAIVESELPFGAKEIQKFTQSELITILDTTEEYKLKFKIESIDSLGNYLEGFPSGILDFEINKEVLTISSGNGLDLKNSGFYKSDLLILIQHRTDFNLIELDKKSCKKINDSTIRIFRTPSQIKKQEKGKVIVKLSTPRGL